MSIRAHLTEKSLMLAKQGKYTFWVKPASSKGQIKAEVAKLFGVRVVGIKTLTVKGKVLRKKAIVTLGKDQKIDLFEEKK